MAEVWYRYSVGGYNMSSGRDCAFSLHSGTAAPTAASITNIEIWVVLSVSSPASSTNRFKWIQYNGTQVIGQTDTTGINVWNYHGYYSDNPSKKAYCYASTTNSTLKSALAGASNITLKIAAINTGSGTSYGRGCEIKVTYTPYSACGAPTSVTCSRSRGVVTISWSGATSGTSNAISSYAIIRNTSASTSGATTINSSLASTATSGSTTNSPGAGTFYYGVRTQGAAGSSYYSGYKWSSAITVPARPTVTAGTVITKT